MAIGARSASSINGKPDKGALECLSNSWDQREQKNRKPDPRIGFNFTDLIVSTSPESVISAKKPKFTRKYDDNLALRRLSFA